MINNIQALRAFAAINVVLFHIIGTAPSYSQNTSHLNILRGWGSNGVDIFFVISGFIIFHTQMTRKKSVGEFVQSRIIRIIPIYWLITLVFILLVGFASSLFRERVITYPSVLSSLSFSSQLLQNKNPIIYVGWTLEWEMLFYLIFALSLHVNSLKKMIGFIGAMLICTAIALEQYIIIEFFFGILVAWTFQKKTHFKNHGIIALLAGMLLLALSMLPGLPVLEMNKFRVIIWGVPALLIVFGAVHSPQLKNSTLSFLGDASYSIYLIQALSIPAFYKLSVKFTNKINGDVLAALCLIFTAALGCAVYFFIEKPLSNYLKSRLSNKNRGAAA